MLDHLSFLAVFLICLIGFAYSLAKRDGSLIVVTAVASVASADLLTNAASLSGFGWSMDILISGAVLLVARPKTRSAAPSHVKCSEIGLGVLLLYGVSVCFLGLALYPRGSLIKLACLALVYVLGARIIGELAYSSITSSSVARVMLFSGWISPAALLVAVTAISAVLGIGSEAVFDTRTPIQLGPFSTPRLLNAALGPTFLGNTSLLVLVILTFALFNTRSRLLRVLIIFAWLGYFAVLLWSGTRTALVGGWVSCCGTLLTLTLIAHRPRVRRRALFALVLALCLPFGDVDAISRFLSRSSGDSVLDFARLYESGRGRYRDNTYRWIGYGSHDSMFGAGLGAGTVISRDIMNVSTLQRDNDYGLIEPFFELIIFEWGLAGGALYAGYWLWLSWVVLRGDLRDVRNGKPWAGLVTCWLMYVWAGTVTSFGFGIVNTTLLFMFGVSRLVTPRGRSSLAGRAAKPDRRRGIPMTGPWMVGRPGDQAQVVFPR